MERSLLSDWSGGRKSKACFVFIDDLIETEEKFNRQIKTQYLKFKYTFFIYAEDHPQKSIVEFCKYTLSIQLLEQIYNNSILVFQSRVSRRKLEITQ